MYNYFGYISHTGTVLEDFIIIKVYGTCNVLLHKTFKNSLNVTLNLLKHPVSQFYGIGDEHEMSNSAAFNRPHDVCT